jgi:anti-sigma B factor antagonist
VVMDVEITRMPELALLSVRGEIDLETSPKLRELLEALDEDLGVIVDLSSVTFLDSSGLSELVQANERHAAAGGVRLVVTSTWIRRVLEVSGLADVFSTFDNVDDATRGA